ncbi:MAG: hypothetical protein OXG25_10555 [Gammaproteobacteria bacterium]|nr:hypothetical protein [Gammaproteobacteria bacterium]
MSKPQADVRTIAGLNRQVLARVRTSGPLTSSWTFGGDGSLNFNIGLSN